MVTYPLSQIELLQSPLWIRLSAQAIRRHEGKALFMGTARSEQPLLRTAYSQQ